MIIFKHLKHSQVKGELHLFSGHNQSQWADVTEMQILVQLKEEFLTSGQDGGIGRHTSPTCTTIRRITTNLKTKNTQSCQKIELYGSPTTKDLKKPYSSRQVGGVETGSWGREKAVLAARGQQRPVEWVVPHSGVGDKNQEKYLGSEQSQPQARSCSPGF